MNFSLQSSPIKISAHKILRQRKSVDNSCLYTDLTERRRASRSRQAARQIPDGLTAKPLIDIYKKKREKSREACRVNCARLPSHLPWNSPKIIKTSKRSVSPVESVKSFSGLSQAQKRSALRRRSKQRSSSPNNLLNTHKMAEIVVGYLHWKYPDRLYQNCEQDPESTTYSHKDSPKLNVARNDCLDFGSGLATPRSKELYEVKKIGTDD